MFDKLLDENGNLPPTVRVVIIILLCGLMFSCGNVTGWFAHANWSLRGEANQIVADTKRGVEILQNVDATIIQQEQIFEQVDADVVNKPNNFNTDCIDSNLSNYVERLRSDSRTEGTDDY